jgi:hypothetical protein
MMIGVGGMVEDSSEGRGGNIVFVAPEDYNAIRLYDAYGMCLYDERYWVLIESFAKLKELFLMNILKVVIRLPPILTLGFDFGEDFIG